MSDTDMLHHADGDNAVEAAIEIAVVDFAEFDAIADAGCVRTLARDANLFRRQVDRDNTDPSLAGKMDGEAAPTGTDLGHGHIRLQLQFGGDVDELVTLG